METTDLEPNESVQNIYCSAAHEYEFVCVCMLIKHFTEASFRETVSK